MFRRQRMMVQLGWTRTNTTTRHDKAPILYLAHILPNEASSWWGTACGAPPSPGDPWRGVGGRRGWRRSSSSMQQDDNDGKLARPNRESSPRTWGSLRGWENTCRRPGPPVDGAAGDERLSVASLSSFNCMCKCVCMFVIFLRLSHSSFQLRLALYQRVVSVAERLANLIVVPCRPHWYQSDNTGWHLNFFLIGRYNSTVSEAAEIPVLSALTQRWPESRPCPSTHRCPL